MRFSRVSARKARRSSANRKRLWKAGCVATRTSVMAGGSGKKSRGSNSSGRCETQERNCGPSVTNIFGVQDEIVSKVVTTLSLSFKLDDMNLPGGGDSKPTDNLETFDDILRATEYLWRVTKDDNARARLWAEKATEHDPKFAEAYAVWGWAYFSDGVYQWGKNPRADLERSSAPGQKALALDDSSCDALGLLSGVDLIQRQFGRAVADGERAVAINPNCTTRLYGSLGQRSRS
jgi:hypothetical protein